MGASLMHMYRTRFNKNVLIPLILVILFIQQFAFGKEDGIEEAGDILQIALPVGAGVSTLVLKDWEGTKQFAKAFGASWLTTYTLKFAVGKMRPNGTARNSFPSGHTMGAFAGAAFIDNRYGHLYGYPAYALAAFTGFSRVHSDWHFLDDVVAGASVSLLWSWHFVTPYKKKEIVKYKEDPLKPRPRYTWSFGPALLGKNIVRVPADGGTEFNLNNFNKNDDPTTTANAIVTLPLNQKQELEFVLAPFESRDVGQFSEPVSFAGKTFPENIDTRSAWRYYTLQGVWLYSIVNNEQVKLQGGIGLSAQFTTVELRMVTNTDTIEAKVDDNVILPYVRLVFAYHLSRKFSVIADGQGIKLSNDSFLDTGISLMWNFNPDWHAALGYRFYAVEISTDELFNQVQYPSIFGVSFGHSF